MTDHSGDHWREHALCRNADAEIFFPIGTTGPALEQVEHAKRICGPCPVKDFCLAEALSIPGCEGVWAGTDKADRELLVHAYRRQQVNA